jgi:hypothetical protein
MSNNNKSLANTCSNGMFGLKERKRDEIKLWEQINELGLTLVKIHLLIFVIFFLPLSFHQTKHTLKLHVKNFK